MAEYLKSNDWKVTVITGFPYYPKWKISEPYKKKKKYLDEIINGIRILRYKQFVPSNPKFLNRIIHIIDFTTGSISNINKIKKSDVVLSIIPFTSSAWLGKKLSKKLNAKHWIHIQDFEFDIALDAGIIKNKKLNNYFSRNILKFERKILNSANIVSTISTGMLEKLKNKCSTKIIYFPNWIDNDNIDPTSANEHPIMKSSKFKVLYSGNIGEKQNWDLFMKVIDVFKNNNAIEFYIVGEGSFKNSLVNKTIKFKNVKHFDPVPYMELNDLLCSANLHILFQKNNIIDSVMPSKILGMLASKVPVLVTGNINSEIARIIKTEKIGYFFSANEEPALIKKISKLCSNDSQNKEMTENARNFVIESFSKEKTLHTFIHNLKQLNEN